tara:strand:+ start:233 stop:736 length:504 start_codon:yes stop_codon:yes gene_type:complete
MQVALSKSKSSQALQSLTTTSPKEIEQTVLSSMESILNFKENLNRDFSVRSYELTEEPTADQRAKAEKLMAFAMTPMPLDQMEDKLLQTMMVMVKPSQESQQDIAMRIRLIAVGLEDFPADIFLFAVKQISRTKTFFPSLAEFREAGEWRYQKRLMLQEMLQKRTKR